MPGTEYIRIRKMDESKHALLVGDTGVGKTSAMRQLMHYARRCGDVAVVLDGKTEFIKEFYDPRQNDKIINPKDNRTVYWDFGNEATDETDAHALFTSMFPLKENSGNGEWFDRHARDISAHLLVRSDPRPSCADFGYWLAHPDVLLEKLKGTRHYSTLNPKSPNVQSGVLGTMNQIGTVLSMMPRPAEAAYRENFTIRKWAEQRDGWLFFSNTSDTRDALRPLQTGMIDLAIMRVMSCRKQRKRVWFFFDELDSLGRLSKLAEGLAMMRSTGNPLVLGMQNVAQLKNRYGNEATTIFSQAFTKMVFAVSDGASAKALEDLIGEVEKRYFRESRSDQNKSTVAGPDYKRETLVMTSEIQGLADLEGYVLQRPTKKGKIGLRVVRVYLPFDPPVFHCQGLVERVIPDTQESHPEPEETQPEQPESTPPRKDKPPTRASTETVREQNAKVFAEAEKGN
ncbi:MAG: type IV secretion system DNA-binding domain-containing protein [Bryobacteraceae bacterium]